MNVNRLELFPGIVVVPMHNPVRVAGLWAAVKADKPLVTAWQIGVRQF